MNLAFWLIVIVVLVWVWFMLSPSFRNIGGTYYRIFKRAKDEISRVDDDAADNQNQTSEENNNA